VTHGARGDTLRRAPEVRVRWPAAGVALASDNAASLALEIGAGGGRVLLAADLDSTGEALLGTRGPLAALKVAHHGAAGSSGATFLARARPALAAVSCGRRNAFGHPDPGALARLAAAGARVVRSDREGALWLECSPAGARRLDWRAGEPCARPGGDPGALARVGPRW
jgi:competence protein ComEC